MATEASLFNSQMSGNGVNWKARPLWSLNNSPESNLPTFGTSNQEKIGSELSEVGTAPPDRLNYLAGLLYAYECWNISQPAGNCDFSYEDGFLLHLVWREPVRCTKSCYVTLSRIYNHAGKFSQGKRNGTGLWGNKCISRHIQLAPHRGLWHNGPR